MGLRGFRTKDLGPGLANISKVSFEKLVVCKQPYGIVQAAVWYCASGCMVACKLSNCLVECKQPYGIVQAAVWQGASGWLVSAGKR